MTPMLSISVSVSLSGVLVGLLVTFVGFLLYRLRAPTLPGILTAPRSIMTPYLGALPAIIQNYSWLSQWKNVWMKETLENQFKADCAALIKAGASQKEAEEQVKHREALVWSFFASPPFVELLSPRNLKFALGDAFWSFEKGQLVHDAFDELLGSGIFNSDGEQWRQQRKVASHLFSFSRLSNHMFNVFQEEADKINAFLHQQAASGAEFDFQRLMFDTTFDSICKIAFGMEMNQVGAKTAHPFCESFDMLQELVTARSMSTHWSWKLKRLLNFGSERIFRQHLRIVRTFIDGVVAERLKNKDEYADQSDLLTLFMQDAEKRGEELSPEYLRYIVLNFMVAGRDTTACALTWLFYLLHHHPDEEAKLVEEINSTLMPGVQPTPEAIKSLLKLEAAFMETTRVYPSVPVDTKECVEDCQLPSGERLPKGTCIIYTPFLLNRLPSFYMHSSNAICASWAKDCEEFRPDRWIMDDTAAGEGKKKIFNPSAYDFITFNAGLRLCLGKTMAITEGKCLAAAMIQNFKIRVRPGYKPQERVSIIYAMAAPGLPVTVERR